jgi:hypothetical protein
MTAFVSKAAMASSRRFNIFGRLQVGMQMTTESVMAHLYDALNAGLAESVIWARGRAKPAAKSASITTPLVACPCIVKSLAQLRDCRRRARLRAGFEVFLARLRAIPASKAGSRGQSTVRRPNLGCAEHGDGEPTREGGDLTEK